MALSALLLLLLHADIVAAEQESNVVKPKLPTEQQQNADATAPQVELVNKPSPRVPQRPSVIVVGAGLAGLSATIQAAREVRGRPTRR